MHWKCVTHTKVATVTEIGSNISWSAFTQVSQLARSGAVLAVFQQLKRPTQHVSPTFSQQDSAAEHNQQFVRHLHIMRQASLPEQDCVVLMQQLGKILFQICALLLQVRPLWCQNLTIRHHISVWYCQTPLQVKAPSPTVKTLAQLW